MCIRDRLEVFQQVDEFIVYSLRIVPSRVEEYPVSSVLQPDSRCFLASHIECVLIQPFSEQVEGRYYDDVHIVERFVAGRSRRQQIAVYQTVVESAPLRKILRVPLLDFCIVDDIVHVLGPYVKLHLLAPQKSPLFLLSLRKMIEDDLPAQNDCQNQFHRLRILDGLCKQESVQQLSLIHI